MGFLSNLFKPTTSVTKSPFETNPWQPQQDYLKAGFQSGKAALDNGMNTVGGITDFTANLNKGQQGFLNGMQRQGQSIAGAGANTLQTGRDATGALGGYLDNAQSMFQQAGRNNTAGILSEGAAYADNPYLQGTIDASLNDVRKAFDGAVAGINSGASGSGNINSTRAGALEAMALDDAMDRGAAISSTLRGNAYEQGLDRAVMGQQQRFANQAAANGSILAGAQTGNQFTQSGAALGMDGMNFGFQGASGFQTQAQNEINGRLQGANVPLDLVTRYMQAIGGNYGENGYQTSVSKGASPFQTILGGAATIAGLRK